MARTRAGAVAKRRDGFFFLGNHLALDLLNTYPVQDDEPMELLPDPEALLRWFAAAGILAPRETAELRRRWTHGREAVQSRSVLQVIRGLRERLRKEVLAWERGAPVRRALVKGLNRLMAGHPMRTRLAARAGRITTENWFALRAPEDLLAPLAHAAADLFAHADRTRVRQCGACVLHFLDISKKGTRRWCSMNTCGNRLKVAAYAARRRQAAR